jgi:hypothetical protein
MECIANDHCNNSKEQIRVQVAYKAGSEQKLLFGHDASRLWLDSNEAGTNVDQRKQRAVLPHKLVSSLLVGVVIVSSGFLPIASARSGHH